MNAVGVDAGFCVRAVMTLGHFLWQGTLVAGIAGLLALLCRNASARVRYAIWGVSLGCMALCIAGTFALLSDEDSVSAAMQNESAAVVSPALPAGTGKVAMSHKLQELPGVSEGQRQLMSNSDLRAHMARVAANYGAGYGQVVPKARAKRFLNDYSLYIVLTYLVGVGLLMVRLLAGLGGGRRLRKLARPVDDPKLLALIKRKAELLGLRAAPAVAYCAQVVVPTVVGVAKPMVLLPISFASGLTMGQAEAILAHELAHIRRWDPWVNLLQRLLEAVLFFHPAVWYVSHRMRVERENCCDDMVIAQCGQRLAYAGSLVRVAELGALQQRSGLVAVGISATGQLRQRILRLVAPAEKQTVRMRGGLAIGLVLAGVMAMSSTLLLKANAESPKAAEKKEEKSKEEKAEKSAENPFVVTLPSGVKVELLGVSYYGKDSSQWWKPDGTPCEKPFEGTVRKGMSINNPSGTVHRFAARIVDSRERQIDNVWKFEPGCSNAGGGLGSVEGPKREQLRAIVVGTPGDKMSIAIKIGVASEAWDTIHLNDGKGSGATVVAMTPIVYSPASEREGNATIILSHKPVNVQIRGVAVDKDGKEYYDAPSSCSTGDFAQSTVAFRGLPLSEVKEFRIQVRSYQWAEFKNVSLRPAKKASVEVAKNVPQTAKTQEKSILEFRIAPFRAGDSGKGVLSISVEEEERHRRLLAEKGPEALVAANEKFIWVPVQSESRGRHLITASHAGRKYVLLANSSEHVMLPFEGGKRAWGLKGVRKGYDDRQFLAINFALDQLGTERMRTLTENHIGSALAIVVRGEMLSAPVIMSTVAGYGQITFGDPDEKTIADTIRALRKGLPAVEIRKDGDPKFGPVIERVLEDAQDSQVLDLDTGNYVSLNSLKYKSVKSYMAQLARIGGDVMGATTDDVLGAIGFDMVIHPLPDHAWETWGPKKCEDSMNAFLEFAKPGNPVFLTTQGKTPVAYGFQTRDGGQGLLQIVEVKEGEYTRIRYKLLQIPNKKPQTKPAG